MVDRAVALENSMAVEPGFLELTIDVGGEDKAAVRKVLAPSLHDLETIVRLGGAVKSEPHDGFQIIQRWSKDLPHGSFVFHLQRRWSVPESRVQQPGILVCHGSIHHLQCLKQLR